LFTIEKFKTAHLTLRSSFVEDTKKEIHQWDWVERNRTTKAVGIIPLRWNDKDQKWELVLVRQFRIPLNDYIYENPGGLIDKDGECSLCVAERELFEETGLTLGEPYVITPQVYNSPGLTNESISYVIAPVFGEPTNTHCETLEDIKVVMLNKEKVKSLMMDQNNKFDSKCFIFLYLFVNFFDDKNPSLQLPEFMI